MPVFGKFCSELAEHHGYTNLVPIDPTNFGSDVSVRAPPVQTLGEGEGSPEATRRGVENAIFSWREIERCISGNRRFLGGKSHDHRRFFKKLYLAKRLLDSTDVLLKLKKKHLISINGKKTFKRTLVVQGEKFKYKSCLQRNSPLFNGFTAESLSCSKIQPSKRSFF